MKKIYLLVVALFVMISSYAQTIDLALHHYISAYHPITLTTLSSVNNTVAYQDAQQDTTYFVWFFVNKGPATIAASYSIKLWTPIGRYTLYSTSGATVASGDSVSYEIVGFFKSADA